MTYQEAITWILNPENKKDFISSPTGGGDPSAWIFVPVIYEGFVTARKTLGNLMSEHHWEPAAILKKSLYVNEVDVSIFESRGGCYTIVSERNGLDVHQTNTLGRTFWVTDLH